MVHMNQGSSSGSWHATSPTIKLVKNMVISVNLQAELRPWVPLIRTVNSSTKGTKYLAWRNAAHLAAGAIMKPRVVLCAVEQHAAYQPRNRNTEHECGPVSPHVWLYEPHPGVDSEDESHQKDVSWIGHAEQLRCEGRLVRGVCEGARDAVHVSRRRRCRRRLELRVRASRRRRRLEVRVEASRRRRRLEIRVVAPQGVRGQKPHTLSTAGILTHCNTSIGHLKMRNTASPRDGATEPDYQRPDHP
eukprot:scaffold80215_cov62-Phaeocystis_antarctica.AAC.4